MRRDFVSTHLGGGVVDDRPRRGVAAADIGGPRFGPSARWGDGALPSADGKHRVVGSGIRSTWPSHSFATDAFTRHKQILKYYSGPPPEAPPVLKTDADVLKEEHKFIREDDTSVDSEAWETRLARKYYDRLFKEYALADLGRHKEGKVGLRWRTRKEVVEGKGQFLCGSLACKRYSDLKSYELNFRYLEHGKTRNALVKLFHKKIKEMEKKKRKAAKKAAKKDKKNRKRRRRSRSRSLSREPLPAESGHEVVAAAVGGDEADGGGGAGDPKPESASPAKRPKVHDAAAGAGVEAANVWAGDAPRAPTLGDEVDAFLHDMFM